MASLFKRVLRALFTRLFKVEYVGNPEYFQASKLLIVANHESFLDAVLLWLYLPVDATFVAHTFVASHPVMKYFLRLVPHLTVDPSNPMAMKQVIKLLDSGRPVVLFPEGRITTTGSLMKVYDGTAFVAGKTGARVVGVRIEGAQLTYFSRMGQWAPHKLFPRLRVTVFPGEVIPMPEGGTAKWRRKKMGEAMRALLLRIMVGSRRSQTLYESFLDAADRFGRKTPLVEDIRVSPNGRDRQFVVETYGQVLKTTLALHRLVLRLSAPDERVGVLMPNATATLGLLLALSSARRVPAMLNYSAGLDAMQAACVAAQVRTILTSRRFVEKAKLTEVLAALSGVRVLYAEDLRAQITWQDKLWVAVHLLCPKAIAVPQAASDAAVVMFTSGSEGKPKGVVHSHESILANVAQLRAVADFNSQDKFMVALPLFHSFGFTCGTVLPWVAGSQVVLFPSPLWYRDIPVLTPKLLELFNRLCGGVNTMKSLVQFHPRMAPI